jgi:hypothetical protein
MGSAMTSNELATSWFPLGFTRLAFDHSAHKGSKSLLLRFGSKERGEGFELDFSGREAPHSATYKDRRYSDGDWRAIFLNARKDSQGRDEGGRRS